MKLSRDQRAAFASGDWPRLIFPADEPCPTEPGRAYEINRHLAFNVTRVSRTKKGDYRVYYNVTDYRPSMVRRSLPAQDSAKPKRRKSESNESYAGRLALHKRKVKEPTAEEIERARVDGHRTTSTEHGLDAGDRPSDEFENKVTKEARLRDAGRRDLETTARENVRSIQTDLRELAVKLARDGVDPTPFLAGIHKLIQDAKDG